MANDQNATDNSIENGNVSWYKIVLMLNPYKFYFESELSFESFESFQFGHFIYDSRSDYFFNLTYDQSNPFGSELKNIANYFMEEFNIYKQMDEYLKNKLETNATDYELVDLNDYLNRMKLFSFKLNIYRHLRKYKLNETEQETLKQLHEQSMKFIRDIFVFIPEFRSNHSKIINQGINALMERIDKRFVYLNDDFNEFKHRYFLANNADDTRHQFNGKNTMKNYFQIMENELIFPLLYYQYNVDLLLSKLIYAEKKLSSLMDFYILLKEFYFQNRFHFLFR